MNKENILARFDLELRNIQSVVDSAKRLGEETSYLEYGASLLKLFRQNFDYMWVPRSLYLKDGKVISTHNLEQHWDQMAVMDLPTYNVEFIGMVHPHGKTLAQIQLEIDTYK